MVFMVFVDAWLSSEWTVYTAVSFGDNLGFESLAF